MRKIYSGRKADEGDFIFKIDTNNTKAGSSNNDQFFIPIATGLSCSGWTMAFSVDWGDGSTSDVNSTNYATECLHTYAAAGIYTINCRGTVAGWAFQGPILYDDEFKMLDIEQWGCFKMDGGRSGGCAGLQFWNCENMTQISASDIPNNLRYPTGRITSNGYRGPLAGCRDMVRVNNINNWKTSNNISTGGNRSSFVMSFLFENCVKLQFSDMGTGMIDLSGWDTRGCYRFDRFMANCKAFDGKMFSNLGDNAAYLPLPSMRMESMFRYCDNFTGSNSVTEMQAWDTSTCGRMDRMFENALVFNIDIGMWDTSSVTNFQAMFSNCPAFDQDLSGWQVSQATNLASFMSGSTNLSTANYDALLIAWDAQGAMSYSGTVDFGNSQYSCAPSAAATARASLVTKWGAILDGGCV